MTAFTARVTVGAPTKLAARRASARPVATTLPVRTGAAVGACRPMLSLKNYVMKLNASGHGHPKADIKVIRLPVLTATASSFLLLAGATVLITVLLRATWVSAANTGRVRSVCRTPTSLVSCTSIAATTTRTTPAVKIVEVFAPSLNDCASESRASSLLECSAERSQSWMKSIKHREACRIYLIHLNYSIYLKTREAAVTGEILINLKNKNRNAPLAHDAKCLLRAIDSVAV